MLLLVFFFFNDRATTEIYTLPLHDALPICREPEMPGAPGGERPGPAGRPQAVRFDDRKSANLGGLKPAAHHGQLIQRSEEHTSELQSRQYLVCRLLLEKKKIK